MKRILFIFVSILYFANANAQDTIIKPLTFSGYVEVYYSYDFGNPANHTRPNFFYNYNRHNEVNVNLGMVKASYFKESIRGNLALMVGTYPQYNLSGEQELLKNVYEANVGVRIFKNHNIWIDAGVMPAHIGFESAVGKECATLTRSILAENSPYYEAGIKIAYTSDSGKLYLAALYLNGWQRIQKIDDNQTPAFGTQITYRPNPMMSLNWSTYVGNEQADSIKKWRHFNDFYAQFQVSEKVNFVAGLDVGLQQIQKDSDQYAVWYSPIVIMQYKPIEKIQLAARAEYYSDQKQVIITTGTPNGFQTYGFSANFDYLPVDNVIFRVEARTLKSKDAIFLKNNIPTEDNVFVSTSLAYSF